MRCDKCGERIEDEIGYEFKDKLVCDDCYLDLLIGTPNVDVSKLPPEVRSGLEGVMKNWHRVRPNRHHYYKLPKVESKTD